MVVPEVGHSVLGSDLSGCASRALQALFKPARSSPARAEAQILSLLKLTPLAPARLADVAPAGGNRGLPGRTLSAVGLTLADFARQAAVQALCALQSGDLAGLASLRVGGLRAGWADGTNGALMLHDYSYVPGVSVSGRVTASRAAFCRSAERRPRAARCASAPTTGSPARWAGGACRPI